jgi:hypothetical protein
MSALSIQPTFPIFTGTDGLPLENGYIWVGTANLDPQGNPINVYWDAALTIAAAQPIRTLNGYPSRSGTPARIYVNSDYSIRVQDSKGSLVYSAPDATERISSDLVTYQPPFTGGVATTVEDKLAQTVSVKDFGAVGDGVTDDTAAIQACFDYAIANELPIVVGGGEYLITGTVLINKASTLITPTFVFGGGTFVKNNTGVMFRAVNDITMNVFFHNIYFVASVSANVIAFEMGLKLIRTYFSQCTFRGLDVCFSGNTGDAYYIQTLRLIGCVFELTKSWVIDVYKVGAFPIGSALDVTTYGCSVESMGDSGFFRGGASRFSFRDSVIENNNITRPAFLFYSSDTIVISNNWTEDLDGGFVEFDANASVTGCCVDNNKGDTFSGKPFIKWAKTIPGGAITIANTVNGTAPVNDLSATTSGSVMSLRDYQVAGVPDVGNVAISPGLQTDTFTPALSGTSTAGIGTYTTQTGTYTRIGNVVTFSVHLVWTAHTGTGGIVITNFPINLPSSPQAFSVVPISFTVASGKILGAMSTGVGNFIFLKAYPADGTGAYADVAFASNTSGAIVVSGSYLISPILK